MQFPKIHNNGSNPETLLSNFREANDTLGKAFEVLEQCYPHPRDYYGVQSTEAMEQASVEHIARLQSIIKVRGELHVLIDNVQKQVDIINEQRILHRMRATRPE
jgi:hypothetical protein